MLEGLKGEEYNFAEVVSKARGRCEGRFKEGAEEATVEGTEWSWEDEMRLLKEEVGIIADQCRKDETKKMVNLIEVYVVHSAADCFSVR
jgi:protein SEY1